MYKLGAFLVSALLVACAASGSDGGSGGGQVGGTGGGAGGNGGSGTGGDPVGGFHAGGGTGGTIYQNAEVYGHSATTLYRLDPLTKAVTVVGDFSGCTDVIDIAIDKNSTVIGTTFTGLYAIDKQTASCTQIANGTYPNSLSFVPEGTLDPDVEALVGYEGTDYVRINPQTGAITTVNAAAISGGYESSGDIVSVIGGKTYLTIKYSGCDDCIVEVNPANGELVSSIMNVGHSQVFGLAFWGGSAYGFSNSGELFEIHFNGGSVTTTPISIPNPPPNLKFWGAGSSTDVPVEPPR